MSSSIMAGVELFPQGGLKVQAKQIGAVFSRMALALFQALILPAVTNTQVILRRDQGERYFTTWNLVGGTFLTLLAGGGEALYLVNFSRGSNQDSAMYQAIPAGVWLLFSSASRSSSSWGSAADTPKAASGTQKARASPESEGGIGISPCQ